jgi:hypothetical protein
MNSVRISVSTGAVKTPSGVHGLVAQKGFASLADNTGGRMYRFPLVG